MGTATASSTRARWPQRDEQPAVGRPTSATRRAMPPRSCSRSARRRSAGCDRPRVGVLDYASTPRGRPREVSRGASWLADACQRCASTSGKAISLRRTSTPLVALRRRTGSPSSKALREAQRPRDGEGSARQACRAWLGVLRGLEPRGRGASCVAMPARRRARAAAAIASTARTRRRARDGDGVATRRRRNVFRIFWPGGDPVRWRRRAPRPRASASGAGGDGLPPPTASCDRPRGPGGLRRAERRQPRRRGAAAMYHRRAAARPRRGRRRGLHGGGRRAPAPPRAAPRTRRANRRRSPGRPQHRPRSTGARRDAGRALDDGEPRDRRAAAT